MSSNETLGRNWDSQQDDQRGGAHGPHCWRVRTRGQLLTLVALACTWGWTPAQESRASTAPAQPLSFWVLQEAKTARREIVAVSLPFREGELRAGMGLAVGAQTWSWLPLLTWPDGSIQVAQLHCEIDLQAELRQQFAVVTTPTGSAAQPWSTMQLALHSEVVDPWGQVYRAELTPDSTWTNGVLRETSLLRVQRFRAVHRDSSGREFLALVAYWTTYAGRRHSELVVLLDNGAHPHQPVTPWGPVRLRSWSLVTHGPQWRLQPRAARELGIEPALPEPDGGRRHYLLGGAQASARQGHYLGAVTGKAVRCDVFWDSGDAKDDERLAAKRAAEQPVLAIADLDAVRSSGAFGAHGGPARLIGEVRPPSIEEFTTRDLGPYGGFGEPKDAAANGTPRNGPCALHDLVRAPSPLLARSIALQVQQQWLRPTSGIDRDGPADMAAFRQGLSRHAIARPHGFTALDYEHFSVDLLFDWYWLTGDPLVLDDLQRAGQSLRSVLDKLPFRTSRGEGWCLQAGTLIARATRDDALLEQLVQRVRDLVPKLGRAPQSFCIAQPGHAAAFGAMEPFDAPWQMAALAHGLAAVYRRTGLAPARDALLQVADVMAGPGWLEGVGPKSLVSARDPSRYTMPTEHGPLDGTALMQVGAFHLAACAAPDTAGATRWLRRAVEILAPRASRPDLAANDRWLQLWFDQR